MKIILAIVLFCTTRLSCSDMSFRFEKMQNYGIGNRPIPSFRRAMANRGYEYPIDLPSSTQSLNALVPSPYKRISQGSRRKNMDVRVFKKNFEYASIGEGQRISCDSLLDCVISYISVDTDEGIPIILRGGVGYNHFTVIVRAKPGNSLSGNITVFCLKTEGQDTDTYAQLK